MDRSGSFKSLSDWLAWLETLSPTEIELGLERVQEVLERLAPALPERVIQVAGTNGKGSSVAMLEALLMTTDAMVGSYTSPHVFNYNERIRVAGQAVADDEIIAAFEAVQSVRQDVPLTYFEYGTLAALQVFADRRCDVALLEVGMGGRLDAVNAVDAEAGLITNVSLDHCDWLGNDVESIAREKAGIMRQSRPVIFGSVERPAAIDAAARQAGAALRCAGEDFDWTARDECWDWRGTGKRLRGLRPPALPGRFQLANAAGVLALLEAIGLDSLLEKETIERAFSGLALPGRLQRRDLRRQWIFDVAHNPHAARALAETLAEDHGANALTAIVGALDDKDPEGIVTPLLPLVGSWIAAPASAPRAIPSAELAARVAALSNKPCLAAPGIAAAMQYAEATSAEAGAILVTGSFYLVGPAIDWLETSE